MIDPGDSPDVVIGTCLWVEYNEATGMITAMFKIDEDLGGRVFESVFTPISLQGFVLTGADAVEKARQMIGKPLTVSVAAHLLGRDFGRFVGKEAREIKKMCEAIKVANEAVSPDIKRIFRGT